MADEEKVYQGDVGTLIRIDMSETITGATGLVWYVKKPSGAEEEWTPSIYGTDYLQYTTTTDDQDEYGTYKIQPKLTLSGWTGRGATVDHIVHKKFH